MAHGKIRVVEEPRRGGRRGAWHVDAKTVETAYWRRWEETFHPLHCKSTADSPSASWPSLEWFNASSRPCGSSNVISPASTSAASGVRDGALSRINPWTQAVRSSTGKKGAGGAKHGPRDADATGVDEGKGDIDWGRLRTGG